MKLTFFFLTLSAFLAAYHARHLPQTNQPNAINMVTGEEHLTPPPSLDLINILQTYFHTVFKQLPGDGIGKPSIFQDQATYGRHNPRAPPPPKADPRHDQTAYGRQNPKTPPSPKLDPSQGHTTYGRHKPKAPPAPTVDPPHHQTAYGRENPKSPFSPEIGGENPKAPPSHSGARHGQYKAEALEKDSLRRTIYGRDDPRVPAPPESNNPSGQTMYNGQEDSRTPPIIAPNESQEHASYGRDDPRAPAPPKPADPIRPVLNESPCIGRRSACESAVDHPPPPQSFTSFIEILSDEEWQTVNTGLFRI